MVYKIFEKLKAAKEQYLKSKKGKDFEDRVENLVSEYFSKIFKDDFKKPLDEIKDEILKKTNASFIENKFNKENHFIIQPIVEPYRKPILSRYFNFF